MIVQFVGERGGRVFTDEKVGYNYVFQYERKGVHYLQCLHHPLPKKIARKRGEVCPGRGSYRDGDTEIQVTNQHTCLPDPLLWKVLEARRAILTHAAEYPTLTPMEVYAAISPRYSGEVLSRAQLKSLQRSINRKRSKSLPGKPGALNELEAFLLNPALGDKMPEGGGRPKVKRPRMVVAIAPPVFEMDSIFSRTVNSPFFVDRTAFISVFLKRIEADPSHNCLYVSAPSNFGKTTILSMMEDFFQMKTNEEGDCSELFKTLKISNHPDALKHRASHPVLNLNFIDMRDVSDLKGLFLAILSVVYHASCKYKPMRTDCQEEFPFAHKLMSGNWNSKDEDFLGILALNCCKDLQLYLRKIYKRSCVILVDEIDLFTERLLCEDVKNEKEMVNWFTTFISRTFTGSQLFAGFLTGRMRYASILTSRATNIIHQRFCSLPDEIKQVSSGTPEELSGFFGLTESQINELFIQYETKYGRKPYFDLDELKSYFTGYCVESSLVKVYQTNSIIKSFCSGQLMQSWTCGSEKNTITRGLAYGKFGKIALESYHLNQDSKIQLQFRSKTEFDDLIHLKKTLVAKDMSAFDFDSFKQYLFELGFFTTKDQYCDGIMSMHIPSEEVAREISMLNQRNLPQDLSSRIDHLADSLKNLVKAIQAARANTDMERSTIDSENITRIITALTKFVEALKIFFTYIIDTNQFYYERDVLSHFKENLMVHGEFRMRQEDPLFSGDPRKLDLTIRWDSYLIAIESKREQVQSAAHAVQSFVDREHVRICEKYEVPETNLIALGINYNETLNCFYAAWIMNPSHNYDCIHSAAA